MYSYQLITQGSWPLMISWLLFIRTMLRNALQETFPFSDIFVTLKFTVLCLWFAFFSRKDVASRMYQIRFFPKHAWNYIAFAELLLSSVLLELLTQLLVTQVLGFSSLKCIKVTWQTVKVCFRWFRFAFHAAQGSFFFRFTSKKYSNLLVSKIMHTEFPFRP